MRTPQTAKKTTKFDWTRSETLALAQHSCTFCYGLGQRPGRNGQTSPCHCVFRAIFRACYERFRYCVEHPAALGHVTLEPFHTSSARGVWGLKHEEYCADFCVVSRRSLTPREYRTFSFHYLLGADWQACCRKLNCERGYFFHEIYRIQQKLGRVFRELEPHALFPIDEYFQTVFTPEPRVTEEVARESDEPASETPVGDFYPLRKAASDEDETELAAKAAA